MPVILTKNKQTDGEWMWFAKAKHETVGLICEYAQIAQSVEQGTENPCVGGSIPPLGTKG